MAITIQEAIRKFGRSALTLSSIRLEKDAYHRNIAKTATKLSNDGKSYFQYDTQFMSGICRWSTPSRNLLVDPFDEMLNHQVEAITYFAAFLGTDLDPEEIKKAYAYLLDRHGTDTLIELDEEEVAQWIIDLINSTD